MKQDEQSKAKPAVEPEEDNEVEEYEPPQLTKFEKLEKLIVCGE
jgi:hypothetical protein